MVRGSPLCGSSCHFGSSDEDHLKMMARALPLCGEPATRTTTVHGIHGQTDPLLSPGTAAVHLTGGIQ